MDTWKKDNEGRMFKTPLLTVQVTLEESQKEGNFWYMTYEGERMKLMNRKAMFHVETLEEVLQKIKIKEIKEILIWK